MPPTMGRDKKRMWLHRWVHGAKAGAAPGAAADQEADRTDRQDHQGPRLILGRPHDRRRKQAFSTSASSATTRPSPPSPTAGSRKNSTFKRWVWMGLEALSTETPWARFFGWSIHSRSSRHSTTRRSTRAEQKPSALRRGIEMNLSS